MTTIAILGFGRVGKTLAAKFAATGHDVVIGSRTPDTAGAEWEGPALKFASTADAIGAADVVINATPGETALERLSEHRDGLDGKILVDVSNATVRTEAGPGALVYPGSSLAEHLQEALPGTKVVKTLNTMLFMVMVAPESLGNPVNAFISGDDAAAKATVIGLLGDLGWAADQVLDLGGIVSARGAEALILLVPDVLQARGFAPFAISIVS